MKIFLLFFLFFINLSVFADESLSEIKTTLDRINKDISDLQKEIYTGGKKNSNIKSDSQDISIFDMRLRDIEKELKTINLNYENLYFEIDEIKSLFKELNLEFNSLRLDNQKFNNNNTIENNSETETLEENSLGSLKINSEDLSSSDITEDLDNENQVSDMSPEELYQIAFDLLRSQKFDKAENALKDFIDDYPENKLAGSAYYWLGEMYLLKKENTEAALTFAEGYQKYPESIKAADSLYKLGESLIKISKNKEACETFDQFKLKYPNHKLISKIETEAQGIDCK